MFHLERTREAEEMSQRVDPFAADSVEISLKLDDNRFSVLGSVCSVGRVRAYHCLHVQDF